MNGFNETADIEVGEHEWMDRQAEAVGQDMDEVQRLLREDDEAGNYPDGTQMADIDPFANIDSCEALRILDGIEETDDFPF